MQSMKMLIKDVGFAATEQKSSAKALTVRAAKFSKSAKEKIEAAGGKTEVVA